MSEPKTIKAKVTTTETEPVHYVPVRYERGESKTYTYVQVKQTISNGEKRALMFFMIEAFNVGRHDKSIPNITETALWNDLVDNFIAVRDLSKIREYHNVDQIMGNLPKGGDWDYYRDTIKDLLIDENKHWSEKKYKIERGET